MNIYVKYPDLFYRNCDILKYSKTSLQKKKKKKRKEKEKEKEKKKKKKKRTD